MNNINYEEKEYSWKAEQENLLKKWGDHALCYRLMHDRAYKKYWCLNAWFNIPVIIISTVTGTGNFASVGIQGLNNSTFIFVLGAMNILSGILATINSYIGIAQKIEAHRITSISWDKFNRKIQIELAKIRDDRINAKDFIRHTIDEYNRLIDISPILSNDIIRWFIKIIDTGYFDDDFDDALLCLYDCLCFPFGCYICSFCKLCCSKKRKKTNRFNNLHNIELPEIVGYIKPILIANEKSFIENNKNIEDSTNFKINILPKDISLTSSIQDSNITITNVKTDSDSENIYSPYV